MTDVGTVTADDFETWAVEPFDLHLSTGDRLALHVAEVTRDRGRLAGRAAFSVLFEADPGTPVAQSTHRLEHPVAGMIDLFLVPVAPDGGRARYEAVFA
jgi:hypothetical protein